MQRIIGTEVEYGISSPSDPTANPILTSTQAVLAYAAAAGIQRAKRTRWDYEVESPLRDARGFDLSRRVGPPPVVDADEVGAANMILTNGARLYVDHAHPEYSAPEVHRPDGRGDLGQGRRAGDGGGGPARRQRARRGQAAALQEQRRRQGRVVRIARELPDVAPDAVLRGHRRADAVPGVASGGHRVRSRRHRPVRRRARLPAVASAPTTSRSRSAWRPPSSAASSTPATNRTPTPTSTGGCTSSSATPTSPRRRPISRSAPPRWCSTSSRRACDLSRPGAGPAGARRARHQPRPVACAPPSRWPTAAS